jgi:hypothetical protein
MKDSRKRYIGLDVHKHYLIALGVDEELNIVLPSVLNSRTWRRGGKGPSPGRMRWCWR